MTMAMTYHGLTYHGLIYPPPGRGREAAGLANAGATVAPRCFGKNLKIMFKSNNHDTFLAGAWGKWAFMARVPPQAQAAP